MTVVKKTPISIGTTLATGVSLKSQSFGTCIRDDKERFLVCTGYNTTLYFRVGLGESGSSWTYIS